MTDDCRLVEVARAAQALAPRVAPPIYIKIKLKNNGPKVKQCRQVPVELIVMSVD
jgi:hypothetical protein